MTTDDSTIHALPVHDRSRVARRIGAVAAVAVLTLGACTSDPGARRVAEDIIKAEALDNPDLDEQCMLDALDGFTDQELEDITSQLESSNEDTRADGEVALGEFEAALGACN